MAELEQGITFVVTSVGRRDPFVQDRVIESIRSQALPRWETVVVGRYDGACDRYVALSTWPEYFYKPLQRGVEAAAYQWIVPLDDDMLLGKEWWAALREGLVATREVADIYGFTLVRPDGTIWATSSFATHIPSEWAGVWAYRALVDDNTYFGASLARRTVFSTCPYPTFMSGDRAHGLDLAQSGFRRQFLRRVHVVHHGIEHHLERCATPEYERTLVLRRNLGEQQNSCHPDREASVRAWIRYAAKVERTPKRIAIFGWFGYGNVGDELIAREMIRACPGHEISIVSDRLDNTTPYFGAPVLRVRPFLKESGDFDMLLFGGGGVLHDAFVRTLVTADEITRLRCPVIVYAAGVPFSDWLEGTEHFLNRAYLITLRDPISQAAVKARHPDRPVDFLPDPAFLNRPSGRPKDPRSVVLNPRFIPAGWQRGLHPEFEGVVVNALKRLCRHLERGGWSPRTIVFEARDLPLARKLEVPSRLVNLDEAEAEISGAAFVVTERLHGAILSATQGTPFLMVDYQMKMRGLARVLDAEPRLIDPSKSDLTVRFDSLCGRDLGLETKIDALRSQIDRFHKTYLDRVLPVEIVNRS